ncbi:hypothetical protein MAR_010669 [Mya arenaria]|uniref:Chitin-binding type-2 domain-containing protein n=1 Tax=Mya arenaria TaxID=6604 RepID=A0ABY7FRW6_MYAAR|nr:hypothetical protein MAR_010669 [Mya arenaria]
MSICIKEQNDCVFAGFLNGANPCTAQAISAQALFFSHPDPTKFIQCDLQGNAFVQRCPSGLVATNPCVNNALQALNFPHPSDASKFLQCGLYERMYVVQCPTGELYDQATSSCITQKAR